MPEFKLTINDVKTGKSFQKTITGAESDVFKGRKIKDKVAGDGFGLKGYELEITGGSDKAGFAMRYDLEGMGRKKPLLTKGPCVHIKRKGMKKRKTVIGNNLSHNITQINVKITKYGTKSINEIFGVKEESKAEEKTPETPKSEEKPKEEAKPKEEKPDEKTSKKTEEKTNKEG